MVTSLFSNELNGLLFNRNGTGCHEKDGLNYCLPSR